MFEQEIVDTAEALVAEGKGILAADESNGTMGNRLKAVGVENTEENRRAYRSALLSAEGASNYISGVILYDETLRQKTNDGTPIPKFLASVGIIPGIKVDTGAKELSGSETETITEGLDGLRDRLKEYRALGARFTKWRAVIRIGAHMPSRYAIDVNAHALARYAVLAQEAGLVPIVEPEVLMEGDHDLDRCFEVTEEVLHTVFHELHKQGVLLEGMLLKPSMVISGMEHADQASVDEVAEATLVCLRRTVPAAVPGIVFLSGGQADDVATEHLNAMNKLGPHAWELSFSYGRALQASALQTWSGKKGNVEAAQRTFIHRAKCNSAARTGEYTRQMEKDA